MGSLATPRPVHPTNTSAKLSEDLLAHDLSLQMVCPPCPLLLNALISASHPLVLNDLGAFAYACNTRSLVNKLHNFPSFVYATDYDLICTTEPWSNGKIYDSKILLNGYSIFRRDRSSRGGGILVAVSDTPAKPIFTSDSYSYYIKLFIFIVILNPSLLRSYPIKFWCTYIPSVVNKSLETENHTIILGDFNEPCALIAKARTRLWTSLN